MAVNTPEVSCFSGVGKKSGISDPRKTLRKDVRKEPSNKLHRRQGDRFLVSSLSVRHGECDRLSIIILDSAVGDCSAEGIPGQVFNCIAISVKGADDMTDPFCFI